MLASVWLAEVWPADVNSKYNLCDYDDLGPYGIINFLDFAIYADGWDGNLPDLDNFVQLWMTDVDTDDPYNLYRFDDDTETVGLINYLDHAVLGQNWKKSSYD